MKLIKYCVLIALYVSVQALADDESLEEITVAAKRVANQEPASTYASLVTALRFDPLTELQSRGLPEGQADVTVRGGLFENTGFQIAAVSITDPQTGHYVAELPIDPAFLSAPEVLKDISNAQNGFNAAIATVRYDLLPLQSDASVLVGVGNDNLNFQSLRFASVTENSNGAASGLAMSAARSEGDGTVTDGDHDFNRLHLQWQRRVKGAQSDIIIARQDKFYAWPGAYTGFASLPETDDTETVLFLANHKRDTESGWFELSGYLRNLTDDYDFDRRTEEANAPGAFDHKTRSVGLGFQGLTSAAGISWRYGGQYTADELLDSTDLVNGDFTSRRYLKLSLVPTWEFEMDAGRRIELQAGLTYDSSNRDSDVISPLLGVRFDALSRTVALEYSEASQVPGYTVLKSGSSGLFGGNPALGREEARTVTASFTERFEQARFFLAVFSREDESLVDWTFSTEAPFSRQANAVDLDVTGIEALYFRRFSTATLTAGISWLDKDADYGSASVDASFYALNYAERRATLALTWELSRAFTLRMDHEFREQAKNPLRNSSSSAYLGAISLQWTAPQSGLSVQLTADNIADDDYEYFPGTPGVGRQFSASIRYDW